jgi:hypothetical protein
MSTGPPLLVDLWNSLPPEAQALIMALRADVAELQTRVRALQQQVNELQNQPNQNSTNSSRPPSTDPRAGPVDVRAHRGHRADQQHGGASIAARGDVA